MEELKTNKAEVIENVAETVQNMDVVDDVVYGFVEPKTMPTGLKIGIGAVVAGGVGYLTYRYVAKPIIRKVRERGKEAGKVVKFPGGEVDD